MSTATLKPRPTRHQKYDYKFCKLPPNLQSLRIVKLKPSSDYGADIHCELKILDMEEEKKKAEKDKIRYEALSWCWGKAGPRQEEEQIHILQNNNIYSFKLSSNLESALKRLRKSPHERNPERNLWIDAICINQKSNEEKNNQVPMMASIYGKASSVHVWLGEERDESKVAMDFINNRVLNLKDFDHLVKDTKAHNEWRALSNLMKREWFSRRWVVQEIALAKRAWLLCGAERVEWVAFADTVSLFNEVETGTRSLSQVMKSQEKYLHMPDFFGHVPALSATRLVEATNELFRRSQNDDKEPLLSLEYLVSTFSVFEATEPRDAIYALLAIARDTSPKTRSSVYDNILPAKTKDNMRRWGKERITSQPYNVDYALSIFEVFKDFVEFSIAKSDPSRALDIICRPWAPKFMPASTNPSRSLDTPTNTEDMEHGSFSEPGTESETSNTRRDPYMDQLPSWMPRTSGAAFAMDGAKQNMGRKNADTLVGVPPHRNYKAAGSRTITKALKFEDGRTRDSRNPIINGSLYHSMFVEGFALGTVGRLEFPSQQGNIPKYWPEMGGWGKDTRNRPEDYWRTLVADRGPNGRNAPRYYPRLLDHAMSQGIDNDALNTSGIINYGNCSVVGELLRRIQSVIWNRRLMRTDRGILGLAPERAETNDRVCILYGCSVPVILRQFEKTQEQVQEETLMRIKRTTALIENVWLNIKARKRTQAGQKRPRDDVDAEAGRNKRRATGILPDGSNEAETGLNSTGGRSSTWPGDGSLFADELNSHQEVTQSISGQKETRAEDRKILCPSGRRRISGNMSKISGENRGGKKEKLDRLVYYELIGECYVHGMMDGEAIGFQTENDVPREVFEIR